MNGQTLPRQSPSEYHFELMQIYDDPEYAGDDDVKMYLSMRGNGRQSREDYLNSVPTKRKARIEHEVDRIARLRIKFFGNPEKKALVNTHGERRANWRKEMLNSKKSNTEDLAKRMRKYDALNVEPSEERNQRRRMFQNEQRILAAIIHRDEGVPSISSDTVVSSPEAQNQRRDYGLKASIIHFHIGGGGHTHKHKHQGVIGEFPNQKVPINDLLTDTPDNPLKESCKEDMIRYFHLPTNNMAWIEDVLSFYYDEDLATHDPQRAPHVRGRAERLLSREYWKGQMHGGTEHPVHARHMRPRFSSVPSFAARTTSSVASSRRASTVEPVSVQLTCQQSSPQASQNFALFMPYLHWETNSRRTKMAEVVAEIMKKKRKPSSTKRDEDKTEKTRADFYRGAEQAKLKAKYKDAIQARTKPVPKSLGPYLMSIARIADEMDYEADERLLRDHLDQTPPLHIRRTLDQSYFWTLEDTTSRDRDQVVYRGTKGGKHWNARVVMVDQLWLWILDERTILTSFPRRWGRNKPDPSGVHKSLRERLNQLEDGRINSVYDLAFIIIDQCSRVFFDRTIPTDQRPEVMDIFSNAIAHVTGMKTRAFETFWGQMRIDSFKDPLQNSEKSIRAYLNVNPEGTLLRECQDIVEELRMMSKIFTQQSQVVKDFKKALKKLNEPEERPNEVTSTRNVRNIPQDVYTRQMISDSFNGDSKLRNLTVPKSTVDNAEEVLEHILERKNEIEELETAARRTNQQLQDLLALKQQQASIIEARMALKRADLSIHQGRSIMLFTIVTILFLPLSFFVGIFGMNNKEWIANPLSIHQQFRFMFPVSFAVITVSLLLAFSVWTRALGKMLVVIAWAAIVEYSPIHWINEYIPLSSQRFAEIERMAIKKVNERRIERLGKRLDKRLKIKDEKQQIREQKEREQEMKDDLRAQKKAEGFRKRGSMSRRAKNDDDHETVELERFGGKGDSMFMV